MVEGVREPDLHAAPTAATPPAPAVARPAAVRAWVALVLLGIRRQARVGQMVWIALALLGLTATIVALTTAGGRWGMQHRRWFWVEPRPVQNSLRIFGGDPQRPAQNFEVPPRVVIVPLHDVADGLTVLPRLLPGPAGGVLDAYGGAFGETLSRTGFFVFSNGLVFSVFVTFLLPIWSLSFATEALGGEREGRNLVWLLTRPVPRASIYLAKFVALLPWTFLFNVGGFGLLCLLAGPPGWKAFRLYWPAVVGGTLALSALFHLMAATFRRAAVVALVYSFFLETILGMMPGYMKRISIGFYVRCLMFDAAGDLGVQPEKPSIYLPVDAPTAWCVLTVVTVAALAVGTVVFARSEYQDLT